MGYINNHNLLRGEFQKLAGVTLLNPAETRFGTTVLELDRLNDFRNEVQQTFHSAKVGIFFPSNSLLAYKSAIGFNIPFNHQLVIYFPISIIISSASS